MGQGDIPGATWRDSGPTGHFCSNITTIRLILVDQWLKVMTGSNQMTRDGSFEKKLILLVWVAGLTRRRSHEGNRFLVWKTNRKSVTVSPRGQICPSGSLCDF